MALYLGGNGEKIKIIQGGSLIRFNVFTTQPITNGVRLLSSDDYTLKDSNNIFLTAKEEDE